MMFFHSGRQYDAFKKWSQVTFNLRDKPARPATVAAMPTTNIHIDLSVAEPVKKREISELVES
jgi:hypothetical protein